MLFKKSRKKFAITHFFLIFSVIFKLSRHCIERDKKKKKNNFFVVLEKLEHLYEMFYLTEFLFTLWRKKGFILSVEKGLKF